MRMRCRPRRRWRMISWPAANGIRCVKPSSATLAPSRTCVAIDSLSGSSGTATSLDDGLRLLAHVLREIVEGADGLAGAARAFPAAEGLVARPRSGGRALRAVDVRDTGLGVFKEPVDFARATITAVGAIERGEG